ncbi:uncharacterized protein LOC106643804 [Copidosoma floridanum]|uniref:uncharacterized protein LOC106643804 n=1 Tax=Copidosoma floridanum TaxID=29053 RepID=UPI0006C9CF27|nr:uncharacterized protein LOC106643804 [Copidosoma floridanum]XP_014214559.1 uncharacterized protein LOC106643804 [Copidosoma floridanum]
MRTYPQGHHFHGHPSDKWSKKALKIVNKMAKLERKFGKYNFVDNNAIPAGDVSEIGRRSRSSRRRNCRSRSSSSDSSIASVSSSSGSRSPSPRHYRRPHHRHSLQHLLRSRSFAGRGNYLPIPASWEDLCHQHRDRELDRKCYEPNTEDMGDRCQSSRSVSREPEAAGSNTEMEREDHQGPSSADKERLLDTLSENWKRIAQKGAASVVSLPELLQRNPVVLSAPKANGVIGPITSDVVARKDATIERVQNEIGAGLNALGQAMSNLKVGKEEMDDVIQQNLSDAAAILLDVHYKLTKVRQEHVVLEANRRARVVLAGCEHDEFLFGKDLEEKARGAPGFGRCRKSWKKNRCDKAGKRKQHACHENEKQKSKRADTSQGSCGTDGIYVTTAN